jgi:hypothetical protein
MITRAAKVELLSPWSAWVIMQMSKARTIVVGGLLAVEHVEEVGAEPERLGSGWTTGRPRRYRSK